MCVCVAKVRYNVLFIPESKFLSAGHLLVVPDSIVASCQYLLYFPCFVSCRSPIGRVQISLNICSMSVRECSKPRQVLGYNLSISVCSSRWSCRGITASLDHQSRSFSTPRRTAFNSVLPNNDICLLFSETTLEVRLVCAAQTFPTKVCFKIIA